MTIGHTVPHPEWRLLVERLRALAYGELVLHDELAALSGLTYGTPRYYGHMKQATKVLLREHEVVVVSVPRVGYKRLEPQQHGREARRYVRLGTRRIRRGGQVARVTDVSQLSEDQKRELEHAMVLMRALSQQMGQLYRSMKGVLPPVQSKPLLGAPPREETDAVN